MGLLGREAGRLSVVGGISRKAGKKLVKKGEERALQVVTRQTIKEEERVVIGKFKDIRDLKPNEKTLLDQLPDRGSPKANCDQNSGVLRKEMKNRRPIRDASVNPENGELIEYPNSFIEMERNLMRNHGWKYDPSQKLWLPPKD